MQPQLLRSFSVQPRTPVRASRAGHSGGWPQAPLPSEGCWRTSSRRRVAATASRRAVARLLCLAVDAGSALASPWNTIPSARLSRFQTWPQPYRNIPSFSIYAPVPFIPSVSCGGVYTVIDLGTLPLRLRIRRGRSQVYAAVLKGHRISPDWPTEIDAKT